MTSKAVEGKVLEKVLEHLRKLRDERFGGVQAELARALDVTPTAVSDVLNRKRGPGLAMIIAIARESALSLDELVGLDSRGGRATPWRKTSRWDARSAEARRIYPKVSDSAWEWLGDLSGSPPPESAVALGAIALAWDQHAEVPAAATPPSAEARPTRRRSA